MRKLILMRNSVFAFIMTLVITASAFAQNRVVSGVIVDADTQEPIPSVTVLLQGTTKGVASDADGRYELTLTQQEFNNGVLVFSSVGYISREVVVNGNTTINVELSLDVALLDDVVVVAYGTTTREALTGSVESVSSADLELRTITSPISALEGAVTGLQTISASGQPGSSPSLVIRGVGTLNGDTDPLYVIDGVQFEGGLSTINQDDIESITILKDAASTSLYGSRAANGVVIITTKKGTGVPGGTKSISVNYNGLYGITSKAIPEYDAVTPGEYYELMWDAYSNANAGVDPSTTYNRLGYNPFNVPNDEILLADGTLNPAARVIDQGLDWYDVLERTGSRQSHSLNISAGGENHNLFFSGSSLNEEGYVIETSYERITGRLGGDFTPKDWLTLSGSINLTSTESYGVNGAGGGSIVNPFGFAKDVGSIYPIYIVDTDGSIVRDADGNPLFDRGEGYPEYGISPRPYNPGRHAVEESILNDELFRTNSYGFRASAKVDVPQVEGLSFSLNYGQDIQDYINKSYENNLVGDGAPTGRYGEVRFRRDVENFTQLVNYETTFGEHSVDVTLGHESFARDYSQNDGLATTQTAAGIYEYDNFSVPVSLGGYSSDKNLEGYFARVNYNFQDKYYLTASARRDGSSVFTNNKWGNFYSLGGSWRISNESFMDNIDNITNLKLRASYGEVGNDDLNDFYISQALYAILPNAGEPGVFWDATGNADLKWETIESWDVALEFELYDRVSGIVEFYRRNSTDLLYNVPIPLSEGQSEAPDNIGDMYNQGLEVSLNGAVVQSNDFQWNLGLQASTLKNEITFIPSPFINGSKRWDAGYSRYDFYLYHYAGVDPDNGDALYYMYEPDPDNPDGPSIPVIVNGEHATTNDWGDAGRGYTGHSSVPDLIGSVKNDFSYKNFDLNVLVSYQIGGDILDYGYGDMMHEGEYGVSLHPDALDRWQSPGDVTDVPRLENGDTELAPLGNNSRWITDASYVALRNVSLSYTLDQNVARDLGVDRLRVFVSGENLFISSKRKGLNPQYNLAGTPSGNDYNPARVLSMGVNIAF